MVAIIHGPLCVNHLQRHDSIEVHEGQGRHVASLLSVRPAVAVVEGLRRDGLHGQHEEQRGGGGARHPLVEKVSEGDACGKIPFYSRSFLLPRARAALRHPDVRWEGPEWGEKGKRASSRVSKVSPRRAISASRDCSRGRRTHGHGETFRMAFFTCE